VARPGMSHGPARVLLLPEIMDSLAQESLALRARYDEEPSHSDHVALLAVQIFDGLQAWHKFGARPRALLESAAVLHDIGWSQTPDGKSHHKWSARLIRDYSWQHLAEEEVVLVAQVARYHRKAAPQADHDEFQALKPAEQKCVMILGGILRLADALDRTHSGKITGLVVDISKNRILVRVRARGTWNAERAMFEIKCDMLQMAAQREVVCDRIE
jgi:exopolyphosphatase/guanosine-5'-triphosphate,3'-diphosphate pyrophosphatase